MELDKSECLNWCFGNLIENAVRGKVAEFIVAKALGVEIEPRVEWDPVDLYYSGTTIEIKSSAYLQSWKQDEPSQIKFDIGPRKQTWTSATNEWETLEPPRRVADVYVFCVFIEQDRERADPLNTTQWDFYVIRTPKLNTAFGNQRSVGLNPIQRIAQSTSYEGLKDAIDAA